MPTMLLEKEGVVNGDADIDWDGVLHQVVQIKPLHLHNLIVTGAIVERVRFLGEVVHDGGWIQHRDPLGVTPGHPHGILRCRRDT